MRNGGAPLPSALGQLLLVLPLPALLLPPVLLLLHRAPGAGAESDAKGPLHRMPAPAEYGHLSKASSQTSRRPREFASTKGGHENSSMWCKRTVRSDGLPRGLAAATWSMRWGLAAAQHGDPRSSAEAHISDV